MSFGIAPESIDQMDFYELQIYTHLIPLYHEFQQTSTENSIKKAISEMMG